MNKTDTLLTHIIPAVAGIVLTYLLVALLVPNKKQPQQPCCDGCDEHEQFPGS